MLIASWLSLASVGGVSSVPFPPPYVPQTHNNTKNYKGFCKYYQDFYLSYTSIT